jgi:ectoine hydroxylase-related dioxygenase (phytanoyl-CoA dioxygenase family)
MFEEKYANEIAGQGYTVIPNVLTAPQLTAARDALASVLAAESHAGTSKGWQNKNHSVAYLLPQKHPFFRSIGTNARLLPIVQSILGIDCRLGAVNGFNLHPGGEEQQLHMDAPQTTPGTCIYLNALHCLDDFHEENGGTRLIPYSQKSQRLRGQMNDPSGQAPIFVHAPAGSVIAFDGAVLHAASKNRTGSPRSALHLYYRRQWAVPDWDYPRSLSRTVQSALTQEEKRLFGFYDIPKIYDPLTHGITQTFPHPRWKKIITHILNRRR